MDGNVTLFPTLSRRHWTYACWCGATADGGRSSPSWRQFLLDIRSTTVHPPAVKFVWIGDHIDAWVVASCYFNRMSEVGSSGKPNSWGCARHQALIHHWRERLPGCMNSCLEVGRWDGSASESWKSKVSNPTFKLMMANQKNLVNLWRNYQPSTGVRRISEPLTACSKGSVVFQVEKLKQRQADGEDR